MRSCDIFCRFKKLGCSILLKWNRNEGRIRYCNKKFVFTDKYGFLVANYHF